MTVMMVTIVVAAGTKRNRFFHLGMNINYFVSFCHLLDILRIPFRAAFFLHLKFKNIYDKSSFPSYHYTLSARPAMV